MALLESFLADIETFLAERGMEASLFGREALRDPNFVFELRKGRCPNLRTIERVGEFMAQRTSKSMRSESSPASRLETAR
jgi:2,4-dienoyl-CoA reductase-like NADH-dependent reductase (Old Yellow Enzyme family)